MRIRRFAWGNSLGADSLLTYRLAISGTGEPMSASFELRLLKVESGLTVFRQIASSTDSHSVPEAATGRLSESYPIARRLVVEEAAAYGLAALAAAFGDNPLGVVADYSWPGEGCSCSVFSKGARPSGQDLNQVTRF